MLETILGIAAYTLTAEFVKNIYSNIASSIFYDVGKPKLINLLKKQKIPVNHDVHKAIRKSYLSAAQECVKFCLRSKYVNDPNEITSLKLIIDFFFKEQFNIENPANENLADEKIEYLNFTQVDSAQLDELKKQLQDGIITELTKFLSAYQNHELPAKLIDCFNSGWEENGKHFSFFQFMCDFFHEFLKTDGRLSEIVEKKWLAEIVVNTREIGAEVKDIKGKLQDYLDTITIDFLLIQGRLDEIMGFINSQPALRYNFSDQKHKNKAIFRSRYVPFVGRENEMQQLKDFFDSEENLAWCLMTGAGGSGKSRLAMELCYELNYSHNLYAGFIKEADLEPSFWTKWQPECKTLIIVDYVAKGNIYEKVLEILEVLFQRQNLKYPVRFLLLERECKGEWWNDFERKRRFEKIPQPFIEKPIVLDALGGMQLVYIIAHCLIIAEKELPQSDEEWYKILESLLRIDPKGRPLFALFVGIALANGDKVRDWTKEELLENHLLREEEYFWKTKSYQEGLLEKHKNLVALITMMNGLNKQEFIQLLNEKHGFLPEPHQEWKREIYENLSDIVEIENEKIYIPIEPDILGEYFVMKQLEKYILSDFEQPIAKQIIQLAWEKEPVSMGSFILRLYDDFSTFTHKENLMSIDANINEESLYWWLALTNDLAANETKEKRFSIVQKIFDLGQKIADKTDRVLIAQAKAIVNLVYYLGEDKQFQEADSYYQQLVELAQEYPLDGILLQQAKAAFNLSYYLEPNKQFQESDIYYQQLVKLAQKHPLDEILITQANAAYNLITSLGEDKQFQESDIYYKQLAKLAQKHPLDEILIEQAKAAYNLITSLGEDKQFQEADRYYQKLVKLAQRHPLDEILIRQARAAFSLTDDLRTDQQFQEADTYYQELAELAQNYLLEEILIEHAKAAYNLTTALGEDKQFQKADSYYQQLVELAKKYPLDEILTQQARAAFNLTTDLGINKQFQKAGSYYQQLAELAQKYPLERILIQQANAVVNLTNYLGTDRQFQEVDSYYQQLLELAQKYPLDEILIAQAKVVVNLTNSLGADTQFQPAEMYYQQLLALAQKHPLNEILIQLAKAITGLVINYSEDNQIEEALNILVKEFLEFSTKYSKVEIWAYFELSLSIILDKFSDILQEEFKTELIKIFATLLYKNYQEPFWQQFMSDFVNTAKKIGLINE